MGRPTLESSEIKLASKLRHMFFDNKKLHREKGREGSFNFFVENLDTHNDTIRALFGLMISVTTDRGKKEQITQNESHGYRNWLRRELRTINGRQIEEGNAEIFEPQGFETFINEYLTPLNRRNENEDETNTSTNNNNNNHTRNNDSDTDRSAAAAETGETDDNNHNNANNVRRRHITNSTDNVGNPEVYVWSNPTSNLARNGSTDSLIVRTQTVPSQSRTQTQTQTQRRSRPFFHITRPRSPSLSPIYSNNDSNEETNNNSNTTNNNNSSNHINRSRNRSRNRSNNNSENLVSFPTVEQDYGWRALLRRQSHWDSDEQDDSIPTNTNDARNEFAQFTSRMRRIIRLDAQEREND